MTEPYQGFRTFEVSDEVVQDLYLDEKRGPWDKRVQLYPNMYVELKSSSQPKSTVLARVNNKGTLLEKFNTKQRAGSIAARNREQTFALNALMDDKIPVVILTGSAGTGKTMLTLAAALQKAQQKRYNKVIITRPMSQVGKYQLGALPGDVQEKFSPYLLNYITNLEQFTGARSIQDTLDQMNFEVVPLQLIRGASFNGTFVIADEMQVCDRMDILTLGSRIGEGSKLVIMGDLNQRDEKIAKDKTGIYKAVNDLKMKQSPLVAVIELQKCERSPVARLFSNVFEE